MEKLESIDSQIVTRFVTMTAITLLPILRISGDSESTKNKSMLTPFTTPCLREGLATDGALVRPLPGVLAQVHRQLPLPGKLPAAVLPRAGVRLLPGVRPLVAGQVTGT